MATECESTLDIDRQVHVHDEVNRRPTINKPPNLPL